MAKYKLIYCAKINDEKHKGMLKVGDTEFIANKPLNEYQPNEQVLRDAANSRIKDWGGTAAAGAELVYCEALVQYNDKTKQYEDFRDGKVHELLQGLGYTKQEFEAKTDSGTEWFKVELGVVKVCIKAAKEGRNYVSTDELPEQEIYTLREEQQDAVGKTLKRFNGKKTDMLWYAKMRFGKTISALNVVKEKHYKKTIIITHKPVVEDSWGSDFYHVFGKNDAYTFVTKLTDSSTFERDDTNNSIDQANEARLKDLIDKDKNFIYFASMQDLRGSKCIGGEYDKNNIVFNTQWDFLIIDEAHEGTQTDLGQKVIDKIYVNGTKKLELSGTPFNILDYYDNDGLFTWDYIMEQQRKQDWPKKHPGEPNPYADMPKMHINVYDLSNCADYQRLDNKAFSFTEFFRTWTGELSKDGEPLPFNVQIGDFVHKESVKKFLDLLFISDEKSNFPFVDKEGCRKNVHSLWMVPGVKEAAALSKMLKDHPFYSQHNFGIANVAGEGDHDVEKKTSNALSFVRDTIAKNDFTITISCDRLTTGVTVKEWTSVFMLKGSEDTDGKNYLQTIFRVQSAGKVNGEQKQDCYVYDFAPDRALKVVAGTIGLKRTRHGISISTKEQEEQFKNFLHFCPIISLKGAEMKPFDVGKLMEQINRVHIDRAFKTGFTDTGIYNQDFLNNLDEKAQERLIKSLNKLKEGKKVEPLSKAGMANNGTEQPTGDNGKKGGTDTKPTKEPKPEEDAKNKLFEKAEQISIRIPLIFYACEKEIDDTIRLADLVESIDDTSWNIFMPKGYTKADFEDILPLYNQDNVMGAGKIIREKVKEADEKIPTERVKEIADIFSHFHNPAKETVLTPWRVVNMHLSDTIGGWCFYDKEFNENDDEYYRRSLEPRYVDVEEVSKNIFDKDDVKVLELNSKSGLYPLYMTYSIYRHKLGSKSETEHYMSELQQKWDEATSQVYVLCQSEMAAFITFRTLYGFRKKCELNTIKRNRIKYVYNISYDSALIDLLKENPFKVKEDVLKCIYWGRKINNMNFDAVIGNPPYQQETNSNTSKTNGQTPSKNIFQYFQSVSDLISSGYVSLIYPGGRWIHQFGKGLEKFGKAQINDLKLSKLYFYPDTSEIFENIDVADGISIILKDMKKNTEGFEYIYCKKKQKTIVKINTPGDNLITLNPNDDSLMKKVSNFVLKYKLNSLHDRVLPRDLFGIESDFVEKNPSLVKPYDDNYKLSNQEIKLFTNDKAGKKGRAKWYITKKSTIKDNVEYINKWQVVVSSANAAGQKRDKQIRIIDNHSAFGRSRVAIASFDTEREAVNFMHFVETDLVKFMFLMTGDSLKSLGKKAPDIVDYTDDNKLIDFKKDINSQLYNLINLTAEELEHITNVLKNQ